MVLLITADEIVTLSFIEGRNFNSAKIQDSEILTTQYEWIRPILGKDFYNLLLVEVGTETLSSKNTTLLDDFIKPCLAYYVKYRILPKLMLQLTNKGGQKANSEYSETITSGERNEKRDSEKLTADGLRTILVDFLNDNENDYPLFEQTYQKGKKSTRGGFILRKRNLIKRRCNCGNGNCNVCNQNEECYDY